MELGPRPVSPQALAIEEAPVAHEPPELVQLERRARGVRSLASWIGIGSTILLPAGYFAVRALQPDAPEAVIAAAAHELQQAAHAASMAADESFTGLAQWLFSGPVPKVMAMLAVAIGVMRMLIHQSVVHMIVGMGMAGALLFMPTVLQGVFTMPSHALVEESARAPLPPLADALVRAVAGDPSGLPAVLADEGTTIDAPLLHAIEVTVHGAARSDRARTQQQRRDAEVAAAQGYARLYNAVAAALVAAMLTLGGVGATLTRRGRRIRVLWARLHPSLSEDTAGLTHAPEGRQEP